MLEEAYQMILRPFTHCKIDLFWMGLFYWPNGRKDGFYHSLV